VSAPRRLAFDWVRIRDRGPLNFVIRYGVLGWGLVTAVVYTLLMTLAGAPNPGVQFFFAALLFPMIGWPVGFLAWHWLEWRYRRARSDERG